MTRWASICAAVLVLAPVLGACSSSSYSGLTTAKLAAKEGDSCEPADGHATGMNALLGSQAAYADCRQNAFNSGGLAADPHASFAGGSPAEIPLSAAGR